MTAHGRANNAHGHHPKDLRRPANCPQEEADLWFIRPDRLPVRLRCLQQLCAIRFSQQ